MKNIYNFAFIETDDDSDLNGLIVVINRSRHQMITYRRVIQTAPRHDWVAILVDSAEPDHYLIRNLSGRLNTQAFSFGLNNCGLYYRLFNHGKTISAYESDITAWVQSQLQTVLNTGDVMGVDLAEPAGRLVMRHYHEHQRSRSWTQSLTIPYIPDNVRDFYAGHVEDIAHLFMKDTTVAYIHGITGPDFDPQEGLDRLGSGLNLPFIAGDIVEAPGMTSTDPPRVVKGYDILRPSTWPEGSTLPEGWQVIPAENWEKEPS